MTQVVLEDQGDVAILRLTNGVTNAIGAELVDTLSLAIEEVKSRFSGLILAGNTKFFSIGLDLPSDVFMQGLEQCLA